MPEGNSAEILSSFSTFLREMLENLLLLSSVFSYFRDGERRVAHGINANPSFSRVTFAHTSSATSAEWELVERAMHSQRRHRRSRRAACLFVAISGISACHPLPAFTDNQTGAAAPVALRDECKRRAEIGVVSGQSDALPPDPSAADQAGALVGSSVGDSIVYRRLFRSCMEEAGYVATR